MTDALSIHVLSELLAAEYGNLVGRLGEATPYVAWPSAGDRAVVSRMLDDARAHERDLSRLIVRLRGSPPQPRYATDVGGVHYLDLSYLMPQVIAGVRDLVRRYESADPGAPGHAEAAALIKRIAADHRRHLAQLESIHAGLTTQPSGR